MKFIEEGTGLRMDTDKWYVISDSGSYYTDTPFDSEEAARKWWSDHCHEWSWAGLAAPKWDDERKRWEPEFDGANVVRGLHLLQFWVATNSDEGEAL